MPTQIRSLPKYKPEPGTNPLRAKIIQALLSAASDPTSIDVGPLGMTRAIKGTRVFHGGRKTHPRWVPQGLTPAQVREAKGFKYFNPEFAGTGAGGNLYGEGIYLTEHPTIASGYASSKSFGGHVRTHNIPPQAKIIDTSAPLTAKELNEVLNRVGHLDSVWDKKSAYGKKTLAEAVQMRINRKKVFKEPRGITVVDIENLLSSKYGSRSELLPFLVKNMGYDGISYKAGEVMGLPPGVPEGTKNYVIYNYDIINKPREVARQRAFTTKKGEQK